MNVNNIFNTKYETNAALYTGMIGDEKYYDAYYFPQAGINCLGGVRVRF
jgi:outer membrane receptor protein involved in Fe transport